MEHDDLEQRLAGLGRQPLPPGLASEHLTRIAEAGTTSRWPSKLRVGAAFLAGLLLGGSGLAAAGALPDPVQHAAHRALDTVGVDVPDPERYHGAECGDEVKRNHGAYVRDDHSLAQSRCGKPVQAGSADDDAEGKAGGPQAKADRGPCQGPPPWAGPSGKSMTADEKAAAQAARTAECGDEDADDAEAEAGEADTDDTAAGDGPTTTTTVAETTTTTSSTTTTTPTGEATDAGADTGS